MPAAKQIKLAVGVESAETPKKLRRAAQPPQAPVFEGGVDDQQPFHGLAGLGQLPRDLISNQPPETKTPDHIRTVRPHLTDALNLAGCHLLDGRRLARIGQFRRRQSVERLVRSEAPRQLHRVKAAAVEIAVQIEDRRFGAVIVEPDHRGRGLPLFMLDHLSGQMLDGGLLEQSHRQQRLAEDLFDLVQHSHGEQ